MIFGAKQNSEAVKTASLYKWKILHVSTILLGKKNKNYQQEFLQPSIVSNIFHNRHILFVRLSDIIKQAGNLSKVIFHMPNTRN